MMTHQRPTGLKFVPSFTTNHTKSLDLSDLIADAVKCVSKMSNNELEALLKQQGEGYAKAEASWPKPQFKMIDGVKAHDSYEDYCNG